MSEFLGSRISLISKSDIRYSGILHEINSEESTVSLENVKSYGTEGRRGDPAAEIAPSEQVYEYIVFRGSDVKDLRIEQAPAPPKENQPPKVPDDPAILGARSRPVGAAPAGPPSQGPGLGPAGFAQSPYPPNFYQPPPPGPGQWGRGGPPPPGQGPHGFNPMYPPPPGWFPPGQAFPPVGPWNNFGYPPGPHGPPGPGTPGQHNQEMVPPQQQQEKKPTPIGAGVEKQKSAGTPGPEKTTESKTVGQQPKQPVTTESAPPPPVESKPTAAEVKATSDSLATKQPSNNAASQPKSVPTGPKGHRVTPAVPIPALMPSRSGPQAIAAAATVKPAVDQSGASQPQPPSAAALRDATQAAKAAVAVAMAKLDGSGASAAAAGPSATNGTGMDNLTKKVNEMRVNAVRPTSGRGRGRGGRPQGKIEVPDADFDFQTANAKFNKQDFSKEATTASPVGEIPNGESSEAPEPTPEDGAYNKTRSFFDNIGSEAKDRAESGQKPGGREWRGEEQRKNMETFGQGSVDGNYRGGYRGRGRGRGHMRGRGRGRGGFRPPATTTQ